MSIEVQYFLSNILFGLAIVIPLYYLLCRYFKKSKKKRKLKFGHYLVAVLIFSIIFFIRWKVSEININKDNDIKEPNQEEKTTTQTTTKKAQNNPNYIGTTPKGYTIEKINGAYYVDGYLVVNKTYPLDSNSVPKNSLYPWI